MTDKASAMKRVSCKPLAGITHPQCVSPCINFLYTVQKNNNESQVAIPELISQIPISVGEKHISAAQNPL
jgi:hypothetical protein